MDPAVDVKEDGEEEVPPEGRACYSCGGSKVRMKRVRVEQKWTREQRVCNACGGKGHIIRSRRKDSSGNFIKKRNRKSYPSFEAPGPMPLGDRGRPELQEAAGEELCFLAGNWRIYQQIDSHRYSTDDLVTSWIANAEARRLGHSGPAAVLDIGCGIGSVLLTNAWQLPEATCIGIEAQPERYSQAVRSIAYNVGAFPSEQTRVRAVNADLRDACPEVAAAHPRGFDLVTGTPPYFGVDQGVLPGCMQSAGCLFELRGGVEVYCEAAAQYLRRPQEGGEGRERPSVFVMCNTSLASSRVYLSCQQNQLAIVRTVNVVPLEGKPPLFTVFVIVREDWLQRRPDLFPPLAPALPALPTDPARAARVEASLRGEEFSVLTVRERGTGRHTPEYQQLLRDLGKPCSADRELYAGPAVDDRSSAEAAAPADTGAGDNVQCES